MGLLDIVRWVSVLSGWLDAGLKRWYGDAVEVGPFYPGLWRWLLWGNSLMLATAVLYQLVALPHYARLF